MLAHPANFIYAKKYLDQDINYYKQHVMGTGPFKLKEYVRGSRLEVERNPDYFKKGLPYLDGIKYYMMPDTSARANSIRSGRTDVEFRSLPPAEVEVIKAQLGDAVVVRYPRAGTHWGVAINVDRKPFDDERVRTRDRTRVLKRMKGLLAGCGVRLAWPGDVEAQLNAREPMETRPYLAIFPGLAISFAVLASNLFGDGSRGILDPRTAER
jgi:hypothetical protein